MRRLLLIVSGFAGLAGFALVLLHWRGESAFQEQIAAVRAKGEPITPAELEQRYPAPPKKENAADTYGKAGEALKDTLSSEAYRAQFRKISEASKQGRFGEELHTWMEGYLADHADVLRILHEAANEPAIRYNLELGKGFNAPLPNLLQIRGSAQLLQLEAYAAAEDGDADRAADAVLAAVAMDRPMRAVPILIMQMIRLACRSMDCATIKRVLPMTAFSEEQLARMQTALGETDVPETLTNAFIGERAMGLAAFENPQQIIPQLQEADRWLPGASSLAAGVVRMSITANGDRERYVRFMSEMIDASRQPTHVALTMMEDRRRDWSAQRSFLPSFTDQMLPSLSRCENQLARSDADLRCAGAALAVERFRLANGRMPASVPELVPGFLSAPPLDPFDGRPLRWFADAQGYTFYSVGENRADENGKDTAEGHSGDIVFRVGLSP